MPQILESSLAFTNHVETRGRQILSLIETYIKGIKGRYYGWRPPGAEDIAFPCAMVEPMTETAQMYTTAKYDVRMTYNVYAYVLHTNRDALAQMQAEVVSALVKLFSNNALGDLGASVPSNKFKANPGFWITSEMRDIQISGTISWTRPDRPRFIRGVLFSLEVWDKVIM